MYLSSMSVSGTMGALGLLGVFGWFPLPLLLDRTLLFEASLPGRELGNFTGSASAAPGGN